MSRFLSALAVLGLFSATSPAADPPPSRNAALQYWMAFEHLPPDSGMTEAERKLLNEWDTTALTAEAAETIGRWQKPLRYLHRGSAIEECIWPDSLNRERDGIFTDNSYVGKSRLLARVAVLRARLSFEQGRPGPALSDLAAVLMLSRHVGQDRSLFAWLSAQHVEKLALECLAQNLGAIDRDSLITFRKNWDALPRLKTTAEALWIERDVHVAGFKNRGLDYLMDGGGKSERLSTLKLIFGFQTEEQAVGEYIAAVTREFDRVVEIAGLPPEKIEAEENKQVMDLKANSAGDDLVVRNFLGLIVPSAKLKRAELRHDLTRSMLRAAVDGQITGRMPVPPRDPFSGEPCVLTKSETGYEFRTPGPVSAVEGVVLRVRTAVPKRP